MLVVSLDSAVNVALPAMAEAFAIGPAEIRWVIICYVLSYAITSVVAGVDRVVHPVQRALWLDQLAAQRDSPDGPVATPPRDARR